MPTAGHLHVVIAVVTSAEPPALGELVDSLLGQADDIVHHAEIVLIGVGAGPASSPDWEEAMPVRRLAMPGAGPAEARNRAIDAAQHADVLVFIDDDARPTGRWLAELLATYAVDRPTAVAGPILSQYAVEPGAWIRASGYFDRRRLPTGTPVSEAPGGNLLLDVDQVRALRVRFHAGFDQCGGSDSLFTRQLHLRGGRIVWCDDAVVIDAIPGSRLTRSWVLRRAYDVGNVWSRVHLTDVGAVARLSRRITLSARGVARVFAGFASYAVGLIGDEVGPQARGLRTAARGAGMLVGAVGSTPAPSLTGER